MKGCGKIIKAGRFIKFAEFRFCNDCSCKDNPEDCKEHRDYYDAVKVEFDGFGEHIYLEVRGLLIDKLGEVEFDKERKTPNVEVKEVDHSLIGGR